MKTTLLPGTYNRDIVSSDMSYLRGDEGGISGSDGRKKQQKRKKGEKRLVIVVNVSSPGNEDAAESDGEGMVRQRRRGIRE